MGYKDMIKISPTVMIDSDEYNWVVKERVTKKNEEGYYWKAVAYHRHLEDAFESCYDSMTKAQIKKQDLTIKQAIKKCKEIRKEILNFENSK